MRRKDVKVKIDKDNIIITQEQNELFFEIAGKLTTDIAEAVSIMMSLKSRVTIWDMLVPKNYDISPEKCLYWLSGGEKEWIHLENYKMPWINCHQLFTEEYSKIIHDIVKKSKTIGDIRDGFIKELNLLTLYEFALSKDLIH